MSHHHHHHHQQQHHHHHHHILSLISHQWYIVIIQPGHHSQSWYMYNYVQPYQNNMTNEIHGQNTELANSWTMRCLRLRYLDSAAPGGWWDIIWLRKISLENCPGKAPASSKGVKLGSLQPTTIPVSVESMRNWIIVFIKVSGSVFPKRSEQSLVVFNPSIGTTATMMDTTKIQSSTICWY